MINVVHVEPINDTQPHATDGQPCWCNPIREDVQPNGQVVIHNAQDGRN